MENTEERQVEMRIDMDKWRKSKLKSEKMWKMGKKSKLNCEMIWKIQKKIVK